MNLLADTKEMPENDLIRVIREPIGFTTSMLKQKRPTGLLDMMFTLDFLQKWKVVSSEGFTQILEQIAEKTSHERWSDYGRTLKQMIDR